MSVAYIWGEHICVMESGDTNGLYACIYITDKDDTLNMGDTYHNIISNVKNICYLYL